MARPYRGNQTKAYFSDSAGTLAVIEQANEIGVVSSAILETNRPRGRTYVGRVPIRQDHRVSFGRMYHGPEGRAIQASAQSITKAEAAVAMVLTPWGGYAGGVSPEGLDVQTPFGQLVAVSADLQSDGPWFFGHVGQANVAAAAAAALPDIGGYDGLDIWILVEGATAAEAADISILNAANQASDAVMLRDGIYRMSDVPADPARFRLDQAPDQVTSVTFLYGSRIGVS